MRIGRVVLAAFAALLSASVAFAYLPGPGSGTSLNPYSGAVSIAGSRTNGSDAISNVNVNGVINVRTYGAKGDCSTDDTAAIQAAINAACAENPSNQANIQPVYLPATPYPGCYKLTSPLLLDCGNLTFTGAGRSQTMVEASFAGPSILVQNSANLNPTPLAASITATWAASHSYAQYAEIRDSNGNIEVATTAGTSGGGSHPTWPTSQGGTVADGTVTWTLEVIGSQLATGTGSAYDTVNGAPVLDLALGAPSAMNLGGLSAFTVEMYIDPVNACNANQYCNIIGSYPNVPSTGGNGGNVGGGAFDIYINPFASNALSADMKIGSTNVSVHAASAFTLHATHFIALTYDGATVRLFDNGTIVGSQAVTGTVTQTSYETVMFPGLTPLATALFPGNNQGQAGHLFVSGYYDSLRFSNTARYTANFTAPTAKLSFDANTLLLINFPTTAPTGTIEGQQNFNSWNAFFPIELANSGGTSFMSNLRVAHMEICNNGGLGGGLWAVWAANSHFDDLSCSSQAEIGFDLWDNDFQDTLANDFVSNSAKARTEIGYVFGNQSNGNKYDGIQCDGQNATCIDQLGSSGDYNLPKWTDRGGYIYPILMGGRAVIKDPFSDMESANSNYLAEILDAGAWAPINIIGGELDSPNATGAFFALSGTTPQPIIDQGSTLGGTTPAEIVNILSNPAVPVVLRGVKTPSAALTNSGKGAFVVSESGGTYIGPVSITGSRTNGGDSISNVNVNGQINVQSYGAKCDGTTDDSAAFTAALAALSSAGGGVLLLPAGTCVVNATLTIPSNTVVTGVGGRFASVLSTSTTNIPQIVVNSSSVTLQNFVLTHSVTAVAGGDGIDSSTSASVQMDIHDVQVLKAYNGIRLGIGVGRIYNVSLLQNQHDGLQITNSASAPVGSSMDWDISYIISQQNQGAGIDVLSVADASVPSMALQSWTHIETFANCGDGLAITGNATTSFDYLQISNSLFTQDNGAAEVYLNTFDTTSLQKRLIDVHTETGGTGTCGPTLATAKSNTTAGLYIDANNGFLEVVGGVDYFNAEDGIVIGATSAPITITGRMEKANGQGAQAGLQNGIRIAGNTSIINLNSGSTNNNLGYGVNWSAGAGGKLYLTGMDCENNTSGPTTGTAPSVVSGGNCGMPFPTEGTTFSLLGTPPNGSFTYCSDCTIANPCAGSGTGAFAKRLNGAWVCN